MNLTDPILQSLRNESEIEPGYRHGSIEIAGQSFHVEAMRVILSANGTQIAYDDVRQEELDRIDPDNALGTIQIPGSMGEWVLWITPFRL